MLFILLAVIIMLALLDRSRRTGRLDLLKLKFRFDLFALRDELRFATIVGDIPSNKWFEYLDTTITKSIDNVESLHLLEVLGLVVAHRRDDSILLAYDRLLEALERPENGRLADIYQKFVNINVHFLVNRHRTPVLGITALFHMTKGAAKLIDHCKDRVQRILASAPETSTLIRYSS